MLKALLEAIVKKYTGNSHVSQREVDMQLLFFVLSIQLIYS